MSQEPKLAQPKVAESMFGDDAGFLSGLGISFDQPEKSVVAPIEEEDEKLEVSVPQEHEHTPEVVQIEREKEDREPVIKEARVISK